MNENSTNPCLENSPVPGSYGSRIIRLFVHISAEQEHRQDLKLSWEPQGPPPGTYFLQPDHTSQRFRNLQTFPPPGRLSLNTWVYWRPFHLWAIRGRFMVLPPQKLHIKVSQEIQTSTELPSFILRVLDSSLPIAHLCGPPQGCLPSSRNREPCILGSSPPIAHL